MKSLIENNVLEVYNYVRHHGYRYVILFQEGFRELSEIQEKVKLETNRIGWDKIYYKRKGICVGPNRQCIEHQYHYGWFYL